MHPGLQATRGSLDRPVMLGRAHGLQCTGNTAATIMAKALVSGRSTRRKGMTACRRCTRAARALARDAGKGKRSREGGKSRLPFRPRAKRTAAFTLGDRR